MFRAIMAIVAAHKIRKLKPALYQISEGNPDPGRRRASVELVYYGTGSLERAQATARAIGWML